MRPSASQRSSKRVLGYEVFFVIFLSLFPNYVPQAEFGGLIPFSPIRPSLRQFIEIDRDDSKFLVSES